MLKEIFETDRKMFDANKFEILKTKVAITIITISNVIAYIFLDYNESESKTKNVDELMRKKYELDSKINCAFFKI